MTKPKKLKVGGVVLLLDDTSRPMMRGRILEVLPDDYYLLEDNHWFKKWTYHRSELRKLPDRKGGGA